MSLQDTIKKMVSNAPTAGRANVNFGPLTVTPLIVRWGEEDGKRVPFKTPLGQWMKSHGLSENDDVKLGQGESFQLRFTIDVKDLNPALTFEYEREVAVLESSNRVKTDWAEIVLPSLVATFGDNWYDRLIGNGKKAVAPIYVGAETADSLKPVKEGGKVYTVPKFIKAFKNRDECVRARDEYYPQHGETEGEEGEESGEYSDEILEQVYNVYTSSKKNNKTTIALLKSNPFHLPAEDYDPKKLLEAAIEAKESEEEEGEDE